LCSRTFALFTLRTLLKAIICCSQLNTRWLLGRYLEGGLLVIDAIGLRSIYFVVMPRVNLIVILITYVRYLYSINCPTVICLPSMLLFILWRDTTSEPWTPVQFLYIAITVYFYSHYLHSCKLLPFYHSICLILCLQQTGEIDNLIISWGKVLGCIVCRFHVAASEKPCTSIYLAPLSGVSQKLAGINLQKCCSFSYWFDNLGFTPEGKLAVVLIIPSSWGSQRGVIYTPSSIFFWRRCQGERRFL
jgi:hypothetical protein